MTASAVVAGTMPAPKGPLVCFISRVFFYLFFLFCFFFSFVWGLFLFDVDGQRRGQCRVFFLSTTPDYGFDEGACLWRGHCPRPAKGPPRARDPPPAKERTRKPQVGMSLFCSLFFPLLFLGDLCAAKQARATKDAMKNCSRSVFSFLLEKKRVEKTDGLP
nr:hypothetical protein [Pandoravirus aubagnensis]